MPQDYLQPTSDWTYSHALAVGDKLMYADEDGEYIIICKIYDNGDVVFYDSFYNETTRFQEQEITKALADGYFETEDGLSHELATF